MILKMIDLNDKYIHFTHSDNFFSISDTGLMSIENLKANKIRHKRAADVLPSSYGFLNYRLSSSYAEYSDDNIRFGTVITPTFKTWFTSGKDINLDKCENFVGFIFNKEIIDVEMSNSQYQFSQSEISIPNHIPADITNKFDLILFSKSIDLLSKNEIDYDELQNFVDLNNRNVYVIDFPSLQEAFTLTHNFLNIKALYFTPGGNND